MYKYDDTAAWRVTWCHGCHHVVSRHNRRFQYEVMHKELESGKAYQFETNDRQVYCAKCHPKYKNIMETSAYITKHNRTNPRSARKTIFRTGMKPLGRSEVAILEANSSGTMVHTPSSCMVAPAQIALETPSPAKIT